MKKLICTAMATLFISSFAGADPAGLTCSNGLQSSQPLLNTALHNIYSFAYVRDALAQLQTQYPGAEFCTTGLALSRDIYQYPKFYIQVWVRRASDHAVVNTMHLMFQDASVQALDNTGDKPWIGLPSAQAQAVITGYVQGQTFTPLAAAPSTQDPLSVAKASATYNTTGYTVDAATLSVMPIAQTAGKIYYVVSWLTQVAGNPFANYPMLKGVMVSQDTASGAFAIVENLWLTNDLDFPLQSLLDNSPVPADAQRASALIGTAATASLVHAGEQ